MLVKCAMCMYMYNVYFYIYIWYIYRPLDLRRVYVTPFSQPMEQSRSSLTRAGAGPGARVTTYAYMRIYTYIYSCTCVYKYIYNIHVRGLCERVSIYVLHIYIVLDVFFCCAMIVNLRHSLPPPPFPYTHIYVDGIGREQLYCRYVMCLVVGNSQQIPLRDLSSSSLR